MRRLSTAFVRPQLALMMGLALLHPLPADQWDGARLRGEAGLRGGVVVIAGVDDIAGASQIASAGEYVALLAAENESAADRLRRALDHQDLSRQYDSLPGVKRRHLCNRVGNAPRVS
jgi:hypothetical protein